MRRLITAALAVIVSCSCLADQTIVKVIDDPVYTAPVKLVDIGNGQHLNLYCLGSGSPVVVFDSGLGDSTIAWALVQPTVAKKTTACSYDRAGLGYSDAIRRPSTALNQSEDLHALLHAAHLKPPYVLVGHSMAGMNVRVFADKYRDEVAGMVIVEGSHEDQSAKSWAIGKPGGKERFAAVLREREQCPLQAAKGLVKGTPIYKKCVDDADNPHFSPTIDAALEKYEVTARWQAGELSEWENVFTTSADQTRATRKDFGDMPIIALTHSPYPVAKDETQDIRNQRTLLWEGFHNQVASMSTRGINIIVPNSNHYIQYDHPQVVIDAINQAVSIARGQ
jgi:pimeloyl-ACP methyl ester carboxylesterase